MARPLRIEYPDAYYHVSNKAEYGITLFPGTKFYEGFLDELADACARFNVEVHAYSLLRNEYHLLLKTPEGNLSRFMRQVDGMYTQSFQRLKKEQGSVFFSRYKAVLIQPEKYLAPLSRYLHCLAKKSPRSSEYSVWSSYAFFINKTKGEPWLVRDEVLMQLGKSTRPYTQYASYIAEGVEDELKHFYGKKNLLSILGDDKFRKKAQAKSSPSKIRGVSKGSQAKLRPSMSQVVNAVADYFKVSEKSIYRAARGPGSKNIPRWVAMHLCQELSAVTLQKIAERFALKGYGTVSTTIGKLKQEIIDSPKLNNAVKKLTSKLSPVR